MVPHPREMHPAGYHFKKGTLYIRSLISYFLMIKGSANRHIEDQDFLDRQDDYTMMLILDNNNRWNLKLGLYINSWRIVKQDAVLQ